MKPRKTIIKESVKPVTRREAIKKCVDVWIRDFPKEVSLWTQYISYRRAKLADREYGRLREDKHTFQEEARTSIILPPRVNNSINSILTFHQQPGLFNHPDKSDNDSESKWFFKSFPMFRLSEKL